MMTQIALTSGLPWSERLSTAGIVTLQGMLTIFCVLALLWGAIEIMHGLMSKNGKKAEKAKPAKPVAEAKPAPAPAPVVAPVAADDNGATIAAIIAAISAARAEEGAIGGFRVVSFKRSETAGRRRNF